MTTRPLGDVPDDDSARVIHLSHVFGWTLFDVSRRPALDRVGSLPESVQPAVERIVDSTLYAVLQILDGVIDPIRSERLDLEFALVAWMRGPENGQVSEVELAPAGEGLCIGFHSWVEGDFGTAPSAQQLARGRQRRSGIDVGWGRCQTYVR